MKKLFFIGILLAAGKNFAQVNKADFESIFSKFKFENMTTIWLKNSRTYYMNGTSSLEQKEYKSTNFSYELRDNSIHLLYYEDATKTKLSICLVFPYSSIQTVSAGNKSFTIELRE